MTGLHGEPCKPVLAMLVDACRYTINNLALDIAIIAILAGPAGENSFHRHPMRNMLKTIDFIGVFELHGSKNGTSHPILLRNVKNAQFSRVFKHISYGITMNSFSCFGGKRRIKE
jgi:hypothetical protein